MPLVRTIIIFLFGAGAMFGAWAGGVLDHLPWLGHRNHLEAYENGPGVENEVPDGGSTVRWASPRPVEGVPVQGAPPEVVETGPDGAVVPVVDGAPPADHIVAVPDGAVPNGAVAVPEEGAPVPIVAEAAPDAKPHPGPFSLRVSVRAPADSYCASVYSFDNHTGFPVVFVPVDGPQAKVLIPPGGTLEPNILLGDETLTEANCGSRIHVVLEQ